MPPIFCVWYRSEEIAPHACAHVVTHARVYVFAFYVRKCPEVFTKILSVTYSVITLTFKGPDMTF